MWSYVLTAVGITGLLIAAHHPRAGWWVNVGAQALWAAYAISTSQYGFVAASVAYTIAYARLLRKAYQPAPLTEQASA